MVKTGLVLPVLFALTLLGAGCESSTQNPGTRTNQLPPAALHRVQTSAYEGPATLSRDDAVSEHWNEIKEYLNGSETVEACSSSSGDCYDLEADISSGEIDEIYFSDAGYLYFSADIDEDGNASDVDQNGDSWDFALDMNSSIVDDAIDEWASSNGYLID